jgi:hypothetical protein
VIEPTDEMVRAFIRAALKEPVYIAGQEVPNARAGLEAVLPIAERQWQEAYGEAYQRGFLKGQHRLCPRCGVELARDVAEEMAAIPREDCPYCSRGAECRWQHADSDLPRQLCSCPPALCYSSEATALDLRCRAQERS